MYICMYVSKLSKGLRPHAAGPLFFLWNGGYEAKWLRKSGSLAWLGACETLGKRRKDPKLNSRSDQSWGPGGLKAKLENEASMDLKARNLAPESFKMRPKWTPNAPQRVPWRPPSDPWAPKAVLGCFLGSFWTPQNRQKWS